jgi:hypothetical protein
MQGAIVGIHRQGEGSIRHGVLVPAANPGLGGQGGKPPQRIQHLSRRAFEQATAAQAEQGIAAEQHAIPVEGDMAGGMARDFEDLEPPWTDGNPFAIGHAPAGGGDARIVGGDHGEPGPALQQLRHASDVVVVVVGKQDAVWRGRIAQGVQHRRGIAWIDDQRSRCAIVAIAERQPDVVVLERGHWQQSHRSPSVTRRGLSRKIEPCPCLPFAVNLSSPPPPPRGSAGLRGRW